LCVAGNILFAFHYSLAQHLVLTERLMLLSAVHVSSLCDILSSAWIIFKDSGRTAK